MSVARPYWLGDQKRMAWGLLALLVGLMVLETQLAVMLIDKTGELTSALAAKQVDRFWSAVRASLMVVAVMRSPTTGAAGSRTGFWMAT